MSQVPPITTANSITIKSENISSGSSVSSQQQQHHLQKTSTDSNNQINGFSSPYYSPPKSTTTKTTVSTSPSSRLSNGKTHTFFFLIRFKLTLSHLQKITFFSSKNCFKCRCNVIAYNSYNDISRKHIISYQNNKHNSFSTRHNFWLQSNHPNFME